MEGEVSSGESAKPEVPPSRCELLILHTAEAHEWAAYLQTILRSSRKLHKRSIQLHAVDPTDRRRRCNLARFHGSRCVVPLLTGAFLDLLVDPAWRGAFGGLLRPPRSVVALLCGVTEDDVPAGSFEHWPSWRKLHAEDEPALYVSAVQEAIADSRQEKAEHQREAAPAASESGVPAIDSVVTPVAAVVTPVAAVVTPVAAVATPVAAVVTPVAAVVTPAASVTSVVTPVAVVTEEDEPETEEEETDLDETDQEYQDMSLTPRHPACLTVQPSRVLCGDRVTIFIILTHKVDDQLKVEVEFSCEEGPVKRVAGTLENDHTVSVSSPDMPAGVVSLSMHVGQSSVSLKPVTYYTSMGEVSRHLESATTPMEFVCQAFNITANVTESLDNMLTESFKARMPATGFHLFGIRQIEEQNMTACQRDEEFPTLLHFAAKYGLKKLTTVLLQCPGALQAYSVMNKYGDYPNTLAEHSGFLDLRHFIDEFFETADMLKTHGGVYEKMEPPSSQDILIKYSSCSEDIYESMVEIDPEYADDLYEAMNAVEGRQNTEEALLRKFFQAKPDTDIAQEDDDDEEHHNTTGETKDERDGLHEEEEEDDDDDPYHLQAEDIYDTLEGGYTGYAPKVFHRPPAPIPRPEAQSTYISRVFLERVDANPLGKPVESGLYGARPVVPTSPVHDPYAGMKTLGQRQLIALQERVKVGLIDVEEAVREFKNWQYDHEQRANSLRYQQDNLKKLRESLTRRRQKAGHRDDELQITAPLQRNRQWAAEVTFDSSTYEVAPRMLAPPLPPLPPLPPSPRCPAPERGVPGRPAATPAHPAVGVTDTARTARSATAVERSLTSRTQWTTPLPRLDLHDPPPSPSPSHLHPGSRRASQKGFRSCMSGTLPAPLEHFLRRRAPPTGLPHLP